MFTVSFDRPTKLLVIELEGFWSSMTMARFVAEVTVKGLSLLMRHRHFGLLVDCQRYPVQSGSVIEEFGPLLRRAQVRGISPIAVVVDTALCKLQAERLIADRSIRVFTDIAAAHDWIAAIRAEASIAA